MFKKKAHGLALAYRAFVGGGGGGFALWAFLMWCFLALWVFLAPTWSRSSLVDCGKLITLPVSQESEVEWEEFQISLLLRVLEFLPI